MERAMKRTVRFASIGAAVSVAFALAGCAAAGSDAIPEGTLTEEPTATSESVGNVREYEFNVALAECLTERGWDVEVDGVGGWGITYFNAGDEQPAMDADNEDCRSQIAPGWFEPSVENAEYAHINNSRVAECLIENGLATPPVPDRAEFVAATLDRPDAMIWDPYELILGDSAKGKAISACPQ